MSPIDSSHSAAAELGRWIGRWLSRELSLKEDGLAPGRSFVSYGMDSIHAMMLVGDLEDHLGRRLSPTLTWDYSTVEALAEHLVSSDTGERRSPADGAGGDLLARIDDLSEEELNRLLEERSGTLAAE